MTTHHVGNVVTYIRETSDDNKTATGSGRIRAVLLTPENRVVARVQSDTEQNDRGEPRLCDVPLASLNPTEDYKTKFSDLVRAIDALAEEAQAKNKELVDGYNAKIRALKDELIGPPVEF